ncbi:protein indeterminate-domain 7-like [Zingiber officinale]|uniref:protein indeterminate-domain 7-like n=1 Tax=Zingiber officinale TaxID=94328 RepID=UPI001C4D0122|nr:protein indeterminate-domain 7-like [Zingiber officinale]XP_042426584.1 protein indeterminate-domain 7-like [Zingiber officinale]
MSNLTSPAGEACVTSSPRFSSMASQSPPKGAKKKRGLPGNPDPDAEVIALSPKALMAINRFVCEVCNKGFQRDQNLQLHRRGHNLPWKLKQRAGEDHQAVRKKVYICPEVSCVHHDPSRALGDLTGIKKHFSRKHGEKKWKCDKCSKKYAVQSDWKAHSKICGTREYRCDCGTLFARRDSFITHRAFCDVLAEQTGKAITPVENDAHQQSVNSQVMSSRELPAVFQTDMIVKPQEAANSSEMFSALYFNMMQEVAPAASTSKIQTELFPLVNQHKIHPSFPASSPYLSATALLQKAAQMGAMMGKAHQYADQTQGFSHGFSSAQGENCSDSHLHGLGTRAGAFDHMHEIVQDRIIGGCERKQQGSEGKSEKGRGRGRGRGDSNQLTLDLLGKRATLELDPSMNDSSSYEAALQEPYWHQ